MRDDYAMTASTHSTRDATVVYTIGHSNHAIEKFIALLRAHSIARVADVRSHPYSRFNPQFGARRLAASLEEAGIAYEFLGLELGARSTDESCVVDGKVEYARLARTAPFARGLERVAAAAARERVALLCAERDPFDCHRAILVCRELLALEVDARHIREDGRLETRDELDARVLASADAAGRDLFVAEAERLAAAYRHRGGEIAFRPHTRR
jgi:uncharacterized protein (DUF488 family)